MKSLWSEDDAQDYIARYGALGASAELALLVYATRLLGADPRLVLHGGGNTSAKATLTDLVGDPVRVLHVKGSGWDMATIEPAGLPAVRLDPLLKLRRLERLSDEDMVNVQRGNLMDSQSPNPSVETLLHAFLPHPVILHTHATAILALTDQPDGESLAREVLGQAVGVVPYIMPGFQLAKRAAEVFEANPGVDGLLLVKHGLFTFADTAHEAYERTVRLVTLAEERLARGRRPVFAAAALPPDPATPAEIAPILRGLLAENLGGGAWRRWILDTRTSPAIRAFVDGAEIGRYARQGVVTPDHTIRVKNWPLIATPPRPGALDIWRNETAAAIVAYGEHYHAYFTRHNATATPPRTELDRRPRVVLVPGVGLFGVGASRREAAIAADIAAIGAETIADAEAVGTFQGLPDSDLFDMEYWSLEQAKLGKAAEKPLARQIAAVTGGGSGIGAATARAFARAGAEVAVLDRDGDRAAEVARACGPLALGLACDVTNPAQVRAAFETVAATFGGLDIAVSNAGAAWQGAIGEVGDDTLRASFELNFFAHQTIAANAVRVMRAQDTGGCLLFNVSKQAVNPGKAFGPYGLPKAATLALMKQYALDYGRAGIRANAVNADRIRSGLLTDAMISSRAQARGLSEHDYMAGNLLGREVAAADVADAFVWLARAAKTTACTITVDGGNIEASLR